jgi:hepatic leukemia factor
LSENGIPVDGIPSSHLGHSTSMGTNNRNDNLGHGLSLGLGTITKRERSPSPSDCMSPDTINNPPSPADSSKYQSLFDFIQFYIHALQNIL